MQGAGKGYDPSSPRRFCRVLTGFAVAISLWAGFYPKPYRLVVALLLILPWIAVYLASRYHGMVVINQKRRETRASVGIVFLIPGLFLALRAIRDMNPLGWQRSLLFAIGIGALLTFAAALADESLRKQKWMVPLLFLISLGYGYGTAMETNAIFDHSPTTVFASKIQRKYVSSSAKSTSYHLVIAPWGPRDSQDNIMVSRAFYNAQQVGDPVCIALRPGALGIQWYVVGSCQ